MLRRLSPLLLTLAVGIGIGVSLLGSARAHAVAKPDCVRYAKGYTKQLSAFRRCQAWARNHNLRHRLAAAPAQRMLASWYGPGFYGNTMGCGGTLYTWSMVVAHKTLPCGTRMLVCYRRCAIATVRDRGPYSGARELDLAGAVKIATGFPSVAYVTVRRM